MSAEPAMDSALHQVRFVFRRSAPTVRFVPHVTSGDIARIWTAIADRQPEPTVAIDVTFASAQDHAMGSGSPSMAWLPTHLAWGQDQGL